MGIRAEGQSFPVESLFDFGCTFILLYAEPLVSVIFGDAMALIFVGKKESCNRSVCLSDDPHFHIVQGSIGAEDSETIYHGKFVFPNVFCTKLTPISRLMSSDKLEGVLIHLLHGFQRSGRGDYTSQGKLRQQSIHIGHLFFHFGWLKVPRVLE